MLFQDIQIVPIEYSVPQIHAIQRLKIEKNSIFNHFGYTWDLAIDSLMKWFESIGSNTHEDIVIYSRLITDIVQMACSQASGQEGQEACWLTIRSRVPTDEYKVPRYHRDGSYYKVKPNQIQRKFLLTIKGPGTLVSEPTKQVADKFFDLFYDSVDGFNIEKRKQLAKILENDKISPPAQLTNNQGAWITTYKNILGSSDRATIHSEPNIIQPRLFLSVLPGSNEQIESIRSRFDK